MTKKKVLVIGLGRFGSSIVESLWRAAGVETMAVDEREDAVDAVKDRADAAFVGSAIDPKVLEGVVGTGSVAWSVTTPPPVPPRGPGPSPR